MTNDHKSPEDLLAELEAQQAKLDEELEALELPDFNADFDHEDVWKDYPDIVRTANETPSHKLVDALRGHLSTGADVNATSPYGERALEAVFQRNAWDPVRLLLDAGADTSQPAWATDHLAILRGTVPSDPDVMARDTSGRTRTCSPAEPVMWTRQRRSCRSHLKTGSELSRMGFDRSPWRLRQARPRCSIGLSRKARM